MDHQTKTGVPYPVCHVDLVMAERQGIEIDYCPKCRGVWLDRGELDEIVERSAAYEKPAKPAPHRQPERPRDDYYGGGARHDHDKYTRPRKCESFLREVFDR